MKKTKLLSLEKEIHKIMMHYHFDIYNKQLYIKNCTKAIIKVLEDYSGHSVEFILNGWVEIPEPKVKK